MFLNRLLVDEYALLKSMPDVGVLDTDLLRSYAPSAFGGSYRSIASAS